MNTLHIAVAMKPIEGTFADNALKHGVAGINVDGTRITTSPDDAKAMGRCNTAGSARHKGGKPPIGTFIIAPYGNLDTTKGRWPANVILDDSEEVKTHFPYTQSGKPAGLKHGTQSRDRYEEMQNSAGSLPLTGYGDVGTAARFFKQVSEE